MPQRPVRRNPPRRKTAVTKPARIPSDGGNPGGSIAVVGGGIAGLFCAWILQQRGKDVVLYEASHRLGGRIRTVRLDERNNSLGPSWSEEGLEFFVEFGPMRIELDIQILLRGLLDRLEITADRCATSYLIDFPSYSSPDSPHAPIFDLPPDEQNKSPFELFMLAVSRIISRLDITDVDKDGVGSGFLRKRSNLIDAIAMASATKRPIDDILRRWMLDDLNDDDYWIIQTRGQIDQVPLYSLGFWNLLSEVLSHNGLTKLRDLGSFYHLIPENPNAAEWLVWWLRGFAISNKLQGIFGGMETIVERLAKHVERAKVPIKYEHRLDRLERDGHAWRLEFAGTKSQPLHSAVILAIPKSPLEKLIRNSNSVMAADQQILDLVGSVFGFPMVKTFAVVEERWWEDNYHANKYATHVPTRELHYWKGLTRPLENGRTKSSKRGLIMAYTDRPASSFWANYVSPGEQQHEAVFRANGPQHPRLRQKMAQYIGEGKTGALSSQELSWYGIRDWGRDPYGAANHAWRPERKFWVVMARLADIGNRAPHAGTHHESRDPGLHVCGEAFSDYHGFMEGSLRSAAYALHRILGSPAGDDDLSWLEDALPELRKDKLGSTYFSALKGWMKNLDGVTLKDEFACAEYPPAGDVVIEWANPPAGPCDARVLQLPRAAYRRAVADLRRASSVSAAWRAWYSLTRKYAKGVGWKSSQGDQYVVAGVACTRASDSETVTVVVASAGRLDEDALKLWTKDVPVAADRSVKVTLTEDDLRYPLPWPSGGATQRPALKADQQVQHGPIASPVEAPIVRDLKGPPKG